ncbi:MAG: hypothetical protein H6766_05650 [Candidatus Peribacteria bacterium]|nr:MAG: hypothetical protein H6766_05650 [Candidatus Peribacteria bacterium]
MVNLLEYERTGDILETVQHTLKKLRGAYALLITHRDHPNAIIATRMGSPLLLAFSDEGLHFSSDQQALP